MDDTKIDTSMVLPPNLIPSNHDSGWTNPFRPAGYSVKPGGGQTYTVSVSPDPNAGWTTSTTQVRVEYVKDGVQVSELHTIQPDGRKISFTVTTDDVPIMGSPKVYVRNLTPIPTAVRIEVSRDLVFRRNAGMDLPSDEAGTTREVPRKPIDRTPKGSLGDKPVLRGRVQREDVPGLPIQPKPVVIPRSTFNLFSDLTTMTTAALEREQRENRLAYDGLTDGEAYRVLTDGAGQVASRFEPRNRPDLDLAQTGDDVTLHGGGKFVPRGKSAPHEAAPYGAIPEPRVKPDIFRMMPGPFVSDPIATPDLQGMRPDRSIPVPGTKPGLPGGQ